MTKNTRQPRTTQILCSSCGKGHLAEKMVNHDVGPLLGMPHVMVEHLPALACPRCDAVTVPGPVLETIAISLAALILRSSALDAGEVSYLRRMVGDTQAEFAKRLEVDRATVNRWENSDVAISGTPAYAIRSHVFFRLREKMPAVDAVADAFLQTHTPRKWRKPSGYRIDAARLAAA